MKEFRNVAYFSVWELLGKYIDDGTVLVNMRQVISFSNTCAARCIVFLLNMGGSRISGKGVRMYKGMGVRFGDFISFFLNIPRK